MDECDICFKSFGTSHPTQLLKVYSPCCGKIICNECATKKVIIEKCPFCRNTGENPTLKIVDKCLWVVNIIIGILLTFIVLPIYTAKILMWLEPDQDFLYVYLYCLMVDILRWKKEVINFNLAALMLSVGGIICGTSNIIVFVDFLTILGTGNDIPCTLRVFMVHSLLFLLHIHPIFIIVINGFQFQLWGAISFIIQLVILGIIFLPIITWAKTKNKRKKLLIPREYPTYHVVS